MGDMDCVLDGHTINAQKAWQVGRVTQSGASFLLAYETEFRSDTSPVVEMNNPGGYCELTGGRVAAVSGIPSSVSLTGTYRLAGPILDRSSSSFGTSFSMTNHFDNLGYVPSAPSDWSPAPVTIGEALDQLAARVTALEP